MFSKKIVLFAGCVMTFLGGCQLSVTPTSHQELSNIEVTTINLADIGRAGLAPFYVAQEKDLFSGIKVNIVKMPNIGDQRVAMQNGNIDVYQGTYDMFLSTDGQNAPGVGFMAGDESKGADGILVKNNISSISDLKGKRIAVEKGTPAFLLLQYIAAEKNLTLSDFDIQYMPVADAATAFIAGKVDAAGTYEPYITNALKNVEGSKLFANSSEIPGLFPAIYFVSENFLKNNPQAVVSFVQGRNDALIFIDKNPIESYEIMAKAYGLSTGDMYDIKKGIVRHTITENKNMFNTGTLNNVFDMYNKSKSILESNNIITAPGTAQNKLTSLILDLLP